MPAPHSLTLSASDRNTLQALLRAGSTPQSLAFRCRLIWRAADADAPSNIQIANEVGCHRHTVGTWRNRFLQFGLPGLQDAPRSGRPRTFSP